MRRITIVAAVTGICVVAVAGVGAQGQAPKDTPAPMSPATPAPKDAGQEGPRALAIGSTAPMADVKLANVDGRNLSLAELKGARGTLVVFTCNHCPWAQAWESRIIELGNRYAKQGIGVVAINPNDPASYPEDDFITMKTRAKERGMAFPYVVDATSDLARAFGATHTPEAFLFDKGGKLVYHGGVDDNAKQPDQVTAHWLADALQAVAAGKPVALAETKALGCSIKFRAKAASSSS